MPTIRTILAGISPMSDVTTDGQYDSAIAIDPDFPIADTGANAVRPSGALRPVAYAKFSSTECNGNPYWITTSPKTSLVYTYLSSGKFNSYSSGLGSETNIGTPTSGAGNGMAYYNNYIYLATPTNISRYGPLDGSASLSNTVWTGSTLGSQTALVNTTYPSIRGSGTVPNHPMHVHVDNKLYFGDVVNGQGVIHFIKTTKVTDQGDTNSGSTYNALDLPFGFLPMDIESYGNDLAILAVQTTNATLDQGKAVLFLWDTTSDTFYEQIPLPDTFGTALLNVNGGLYYWGGNFTATGGHSLYQYLGGRTVKLLAPIPEGHPPLAGAVDAVGSKIVWGSFQTYPTNSACVWAFGSKTGQSGLHNIAKATASASSTDGLVTALAFSEQRSLAMPGLLIGWRDAGAFGIDSLSTTYQTHYWRKRFSVGRPFRIKRVRFPLGAAVASNMTLVPTWYVDDLSSNTAGTTINTTNYAASERYIEQYPGVTGKNDFTLQLVWSGTALLPVKLPIEIDVEYISQ